MANGAEDLKEKEKDEQEIKVSKIKPHQFSEWTNFQGREDAEMLQEKSTGWSAKSSSRGDYDAWGDD